MPLCILLHGQHCKQGVALSAGEKPSKLRKFCQVFTWGRNQQAGRKKTAGVNQ